MSITQDCIHNLRDLREVINALDDSQFTLPLDVFSGSTIGQHVRHVLEFYQCLFVGVASGTVNYDNRKRDERIHGSVAYACLVLDTICDQIEGVSENVDLKLMGNTGFTEELAEAEFTLITNLYREFYYNLEHCIHHQALIKIGIHTLECEISLSPSFGYAPSTMRVK